MTLAMAQHSIEHRTVPVSQSVSVRVVVASRLEAFMYKEGFARVSTHLYEKGDIGNPFIHLTNSR